MKKEIKHNLIALFLSAFGTAYLIYYIFRGSLDVVSSDYIRIINYYIDDVTDLKYLLSWEGISRIPFTFLARFVNVRYFKYSVNFDRIMGTFGLFIFNFITIKYVLNTLKSRLIKSLACAIITLVSFSLISWEMILNGSGYAHFITVGLIAITFYMFAMDKTKVFEYMYIVYGLANYALVFLARYKFLRDDYGMSSRYGIQYMFLTIGIIILLFTHIDDKMCDRDDNNTSYRINASSKKDYIKLYLLVIFTSIIFAGQYAVSYQCTLILFSLIFIIINIYNKKEYKDSLKYILLTIISLTCLLCYIKSNNTGEALVPVGFNDISLIELLKKDFLFPIKFILKSFASSIIGVETFDYAIAFGTISEKMIFVVGAIYAIIILVTILAELRRGEFRRGEFRRGEFRRGELRRGELREPIIILAALAIIFITLGHITTTTDEIYKADYRKIIYEQLVEKAKNYESLNDTELEDSFEYRRGPEQIRFAFDTLKKQHLNIFKE